VVREYQQRVAEERAVMKQQMKAARDRQVREICERVNEEHFREINLLRERLRECERERDRLLIQQVESKREEPVLAIMDTHETNVPY
jgi:hypothetical protein